MKFSVILAATVAMLGVSAKEDPYKFQGESEIVQDADATQDESELRARRVSSGRSRRVVSRGISRGGIARRRYGGVIRVGSNYSYMPHSVGMTSYGAYSYVPGADHYLGSYSPYCRQVRVI